MPWVRQGDRLVWVPEQQPTAPLKVPTAKVPPGGLGAKPSGLAPGEPAHFAPTPRIAGRGGALPQGSIAAPTIVPPIAANLQAAQAAAPYSLLSSPIGGAGGQTMVPPRPSGAVTPGGRQMFNFQRDYRVATSPGGRVQSSYQLGQSAGGTAPQPPQPGRGANGLLSYLDTLPPDRAAEVARFTRARTQGVGPDALGADVFTTEQAYKNGELASVSSERVWDVIAKRQPEFSGMTGADVLRTRGYINVKPGVWQYFPGPFASGGGGGGGGFFDAGGGGGGGIGGGRRGDTDGVGLINWRI